MQVERTFEDRLCALIDDAESAREKAAVHWATNRDHYSNVPTGALKQIVVFEDASDLAFPCARPRAEALRAHVIGALYAGDMAMSLLNTELDIEDQDEIERQVDDFFDDIGIEETQRQTFEDAWCTNHQVILVAPVGNGDWKATPVRPDSFLCASYGANGIADAEMVGHLSMLTRRQVEELVESGAYKAEDGYVPGGALSQPHPRDEDPESGYDQTVELYELIVRTEGKDECIVFDRNANQVLKRTPYAYKTRWYFSYGLNPGPVNGFWSDDAIGTSMQGPHLAFNLAWNLVLYGNVRSAFTNAFQQAQPMKNQKLKAGEVGAYTTDLVFAPTAWSPEHIMGAIPGIERLADAVARINPTGFAQNPQGDQTATEISAVNAGQDQSTADYLTWYSRPMLDLAKFACEVLGLDSSYKWEIMGRNPASNPVSVRNNTASFLGAISELPVEQIQRIDWDEVLDIIVTSYKFGKGKKLVKPQEDMNEGESGDQGFGLDGLQPEANGALSGVAGAMPMPPGMG